jgi:hypothetical protein
LGRLLVHRLLLLLRGRLLGLLPPISSSDTSPSSLYSADPLPSAADAPLFFSLSSAQQVD